jgi:hypothetical protein
MILRIYELARKTCSAIWFRTKWIEAVLPIIARFCFCPLSAKNIGQKQIR